MSLKASLNTNPNMENDMLNVHPNPTRCLKSLEELEACVQDDERKLQLIPLASLELKLRDDTTLSGLTLTMRALRQLCSRTQARGAFNVLDRLSERGLASTALNNLLASEEARCDLQRRVAVVNSEHSVITGFVGGGYQLYPHSRMLKDFSGLLDQVDFHESFWNLDTLHVRVLERQRGVTLRHLPNGEPDRIRLGLDLGNGVSGGRALKSSVFTLRLICTNGMVATQTLSRRKVAHRGRSERFLKRVEDVIELSRDEYEVIERQVDDLIARPFDPDWLSRQELELPPMKMPVPSMAGTPAGKRSSVQLDSLSEWYRELPQHIGGPVTRNRFSQPDASLFDFVEMFTEHAQLYNNEDRQRIEHEAGRLSKGLVSAIGSEHDNHRKQI